MLRNWHTCGILKNTHLTEGMAHLPYLKQLYQYTGKFIIKNIEININRYKKVYSCNKVEVI